MPGKFGEKVVIRIIDNRNAVKSLEKLGFSYDMLHDFRDRPAAQRHRPGHRAHRLGQVDHALRHALRDLNDEDVNICTVEDPVEYSTCGGINQFQVNEKAGFTFPGALRALLRQDPDMIMVGEIRDAETAAIATQAALTGHLVFSTLHTNDAPSAVTRLVNIGVEPYLVAASLRGVLAQRLVRRACKHCKQDVKPDKATRRSLEKLCGDDVPETVVLAVGCPKCRDTGYAGRLGVYELLMPSDNMLDAVSRGATLQELRRLAESGDGYTPLRSDGMDKVRAGLTTFEELMTATAV